MPNIDELFPSKYLRGIDYPQPATVTILKVVVEEMENREGETESKPVLYLVEQTRGLVLNRTNADVLSALYGKDFGAWVGKKAVLHAPMVTAFGKTAPALRFSTEEPALSRNEMIKRYADLFAEAKLLKVPDLDSFVLEGDASEATIVEVGKILREKVEAAKKF